MLLPLEAPESGGEVLEPTGPARLAAERKECLCVAPSTGASAESEGCSNMGLAASSRAGKAVPRIILAGCPPLQAIRTTD